MPREFFKIYVTPGGLPIVVSGKFKLKVRVEGEVTGALQATEHLRVGFDRLAYGIECVATVCKPIEDRQPVINLKVGGNGKAEATLTLSLVPSLELTVYGGLTGEVVLEPYAQAKAAIEGFVQFETQVDPDLLAVSTAADADYRLTTASLSTGMNAYLYADFSVLDYTVAVWPSGAKSGDYRTYKPLKAPSSTVAALPRLAGAIDMASVHADDIRAIRVKATSENWPNPWVGLFPRMPATFIEWRRWTPPKIIAPVGTPANSYGFVPSATGDESEVWPVFSIPGTYIVRVGGFSEWGQWARQYTEVPVTVTDANNNGILDHVEARGTVGAIAVSSASCTTPIVGQLMTCAVSGTNLPATTSFTASNCGPSPLTAVAGGSSSQRQFTCTPITAGVSVVVGYSVPGFIGPLPPVLTATAAADSPDLVVQNLTFSPTSVAPGGPLQVSFAIANAGTATANASTAVVRINQSATSSAGTNLATVNVAALATGASVNLAPSVSAPATAGSYRVWVLADNGSTAGQNAIAAGNDIVLASATLTVAAAGSPDLVVQNLTFSPTSVAPGGPLQVSFAIANAGTATANASTAVVRINQSATSSAGTNLATVNVAALATGASVNLAPSVSAPATAGSYRVWVLADNGSTAGQNAIAAGNDIVLASATLTVAAAGSPDLVVQNLTFSPTSVTAGASVQVNFTLVNQGSSTASASTAVVRINQSSTSSAGTNLVTFSFPSMPAGSTSPASAPVTAPSTAGSYRVWVLADNGSTAGQGSANEANDIVLASSTLTVTTTGTPDLVVQSLSFSPSNPEPGAGVQVNFTIANQGNAPALASTAVIRINASSTSAAGANLATVSVGPMPAGSSVSGSGVVSAPSVNGTHYVWMIADNTQTAGQSTAGEANDIVRASGTLTINSPLAWGSANPTFPASPQAATSCALPSGASPQDYVLQSEFKVYVGGCVASLTLSAADWSSMTTVANNSRARDFARQFSNAFSDSFDFVAFVLDTPAPPPAFQNSNGTLEGQYYELNNRLPTRTRRMLGAIVLTSIGSQGGMVSPFRRGTILHEFMHEWGNSGTIPSTGGASLDVGSHWGFSSVGGILGGYYGPGGVQNAGTNAWIARGAPRTCLSSATPTEISTYCSPRNYFSTATWLEIGDFPSGAIEYGPLERYVAGFMPLSSLPSITYAQNGAWLDQPNGLFSATGFVTLTPSEVVARMGSRAPNYATSQKNFRVAVVVLTPNALVGSERLQDLNSVLTEFSRDATPQWSSPSPNVIWLHNFYTATRGVATMRAGSLTSEFR